MRTTESSGVQPGLVIVLAMISGAAIGGVVGFCTAGSSGFATWVMLIGAMVGAVSGAASYALGALAYALTRRRVTGSARQAIVAVIAALGSAAVCAVTLVISRSYGVLPLTALAFGISAAVVASIYPILNRACQQGQRT